MKEKGEDIVVTIMGRDINISEREWDLETFLKKYEDILEGKCEPVIKKTEDSND